MLPSICPKMLPSIGPENNSYKYVLKCLHIHALKYNLSITTSLLMNFNKLSMLQFI